ncbi:hypothetical protein CLAIMM_10704 [Cladophialophora immunda]|nr:hypothetical protein CLAIMM_10704 [Cladophialophora immunda]
MIVVSIKPLLPLSHSMGGLKKKWRELSSPVIALAPPRLASRTEVDDQLQTGDGRGAAMATPSPIAANVAFSSVSRTAPSASSGLEKESVRFSTATTLRPDHDPSASQTSEPRGSSVLPPAELDALGDGGSIAQSAAGIHELEDKPSSTTTTEGRGGLFKSRFSSLHSRSTSVAPAELEANQHKADCKQTGASEMDATGEKMHSQTGGQTGTMAPRPNKAADDELYRIDKEIRKAADGIVDDSELDTAFKKRGTSGALRLLIDMYEPALDAEDRLHHLEDKIRAAMKGHVRTSEVNAEIRKHGLAGALQLLLDQCQSSLKAEQALVRVEEKLRSANHDIRAADINHAQKTGGAEAMLALIFEDYQVKRYASIVLDRVAGQIRRASPQAARKDVDTALKSREEGVENAFGILVGAYQPYVDASKELTAVEAELKRAAREIPWTRDVDLLLKKSGPDGALRYLVEHVQAKTENLRKMEAQYSGLEQSWKKLTGENHELRQEQARHRAHIDALNANHQIRMDDFDRAWRETHEKQQKDAASQAQMVDQRHRKEIATWKAAMQSVKEVHENEQRESKAALEKAEQEYNVKLDRMREDFEAREKEARQREMERIEQFRLEAEELKGELVKRDHFKGLSDPEICNRFKKLAGEVDSFSRIQWEKKREARWPIQENVLRRSENPRKLKQQIVQSTIWMILKEKIFHSPFGVLGDDGQRMHREWTGEFGEDQSSELPHWPEASEESEAWRFERVKEYWDASKKSDSEASRRLKQRYDESVGAAVDDICNAIQAISPPSPHDLLLVREFVEVAATFWLDVVAQKCRVYLVFPAQGAKALVHRKAANATADLVIQPEVRRRGNAQGQRFVKEQVIKGCEGEKTRF